MPISAVLCRDAKTTIALAAELTAETLAAIAELVESVNEGRADETILDESFRLFLRRFRRSFPDLRLTTEAIGLDGEDVTVRVTARGTHQADFRGIPPTGRPVEVPATIAVALTDGSVREATIRPDHLNVRAQLLGDDETDLPWYKQYGGGAWELHGTQQLEFLVAEGLQPHHHLLDVGCGTLRGGVTLVPYLDTGHYWGVDSNAEALDGAREAIAELDLGSKDARLVHLTDFDFGSLGQHFDYYLAYSVFTELPLNPIVRCVVNIDRVLAPGAKFYATFWENPEGKRNLEPIRQAGNYFSHLDVYPYHYDFATFEWICEGTGLQVEYLGNWCGTGPQRVMVFSRREPT